MAEKASIVLYFFNYNTLGHCSTVFSLLPHLTREFKDNSSVKIIETGISRANSGRLFSGRGSYFIPLVCPALPDVECGVYPKLNPRVLRRLLDKLKPRIFITEYYPFSQHAAFKGLDYILDGLKRKKVFIAGCSTYMNWRGDLYDIIKKYYDLLIFYWPRSCRGAYRSYLPERGADVLDKVMRDFKNKIKFVGFACGPAEKIPPRSALARDRRKKILVSRGGRDECGEAIISCLNIARKRKDLFFIISSGPQIESPMYNFYKRIAKKSDNVELAKFIEPLEFENRLISCDLSVNMGGYNTMVKLLKYRKKTIIMPSRNTEQEWNAEFMSRYLCSRVLKPGHLGPDIIESCIDELLCENAPATDLNEDCFCGLERSSAMIKELYGNTLC